MTRLALIATIALLAATAAQAAEKPARRAEPKRNPCASEGPGFVWSRETNSCIRVGGAVGVQMSVGSAGQGYKW